VTDDHFLARWSRRKHASAKGALPEIEAPEAAKAAPPAPAPGSAPAPAPLPPVESLTPDSDFSPFMRPDVDEALKRQALKTLFRDPRFNEMDGLDVYIDDFSKPDPLPEGWLEKMNQVIHLGDYRPPEPAVEAAAEPDAETSAEALRPPAEAANEAPPADTSATDPGPPEVPES
jgi:hypothetical protein